MGGGPETTGSGLYCSNYVSLGFLCSLLSTKSPIQGKPHAI